MKITVKSYKDIGIWVRQKQSRSRHADFKYLLSDMKIGWHKAQRGELFEETMDRTVVVLGPKPMKRRRSALLGIKIGNVNTFWYHCIGIASFLWCL